MLEQLFGSKTRVRLLRLFLNNGKESFFVRELTRRIGSQINAVRNELKHLRALDLIEEAEAAETGGGRSKGKQKRFYRLNQNSVLYPEMKALFTKARILMEKRLIARLVAGGGISYLALTGMFVGDEEAPTDLLIVGRVGRDRLASLVREFERETGKEINFTAMTPQEFKFRKDVTDKFLYGILESKKIIVVDNLTERVPEETPV
jgi:hypothetical protein